MNKKKIFVSGTFNVLHSGHIRLLRFAKELGGHLIVGVQGDKISSGESFVPENLRLEAVKTNSFVDETFIFNKSIEDVLHEIKPDIVVKGKEHEYNFRKLYKGLKPFEDKIILPQATPNSDPSWFCFLITVCQDVGFSRNELTSFLEQNVIETRTLFAGNLTCQPAFYDKPMRKINNLGNTDYVMNNTFFVGVYPGIDNVQIEYMLDIFTKFFKNN